jgi:hypothetical protein
VTRARSDLSRAEKHRTGAFVSGRRAFLAGAGGTILSLPFLEALTLENARAEPPPGAPTRFVSVHQGQGTQHWEFVHPGSSPTDFTFGRILEPLEDLRDRMVYVLGIDNKPGGYGHEESAHSCLSGFSGGEGPSIDHAVWDSIRSDGDLPPLHFAIGPTARIGRYRGAAGDPVDSIGDPRVFYDSLFRGDEGSSSELERIRLRRGRALDAVRESFASFRRRLGPSDRDRLDLHASRLANLETQLVSGPRECSRPPYEDVPDFDWNVDYDVAMRNITEILAMAFACHITPVATLEWTSDHDPAVFAPFLGEFADWHSMVHSGEKDHSIEGLVSGYRYYAEHFGRFLRRLDEIPEGDGTILDHTMILWTADFGYGGAHYPNNVHCIIAGSLGEGVPMGRVANYLDTNDVERAGWSDWSHPNLLTSIANVFGNPTPHFGQEGPALNNQTVLRGPLPGLLG